MPGKKLFQFINLSKDVLCIFKEKDFQAGQDGRDEGDWHKSRDNQSIMDTIAIIDSQTSEQGEDF